LRCRKAEEEHRFSHGRFAHTGVFWISCYIEIYYHKKGVLSSFFLQKKVSWSV
jgi:hypothetical protein